jgi:glycyl-tRNA synthetase
LTGGGAIIEDGLLNEVTNLVEMPTAFMGGFNEESLQLPQDVLISVMKKHQRYFPVQKNGKLLAHFVAVRNGDDIGVDIVRQGNEHVLSARFADANFFVREDLKLKLEEYRPKLSSLTFHTKLGSMLDKSERISKLVNDLVPMFKLENDEAIFARRSAHLMKADLVTQMVTEMTSLQGIIGGEYALRSGEQKDVAKAIGEQYQTVPQTKISLVIALADRLDSLVGLFAAGLAPTGAKDPFGLRRAAIGIVQPLIEYELDFDLAEAVKKSAKIQPIEVNNETQKKILEFLAGRLKVVLNEAGFKYDVVDAVLAEQSNNPAGSARAVKQLQAWIERDDWSSILDGFARCVRITRNEEKTFKANKKLLVEEAEKGLYEAVQSLPSKADGDVDAFLKNVVTLIPSISLFFDKVLVMAEEQKVRENRLGLLQSIASLSAGIADLSKLEGF